MLLKEKCNLISPVALDLHSNTLSLRMGLIQVQGHSMFSKQDYVTGCILNIFQKKQIFYTKLTISFFKHMQV